MNDALKPYLARSASLHVLAVGAFAVFAARAVPKADKVYMIDFVGGSNATLASLGPSAPAAASAPRRAAAPSEVAPQADPDAVAVRGKKRGPTALPRPSLLRGGGKESDAGTAPDSNSSLAGAAPATPAATAAPAAGAGGGTGGAATNATGVTTDLPNFPYPWYISQVRLMLWQEWRKRMPRLDAEGAVSFSILRNGGVTDLETESSSGDSGFDQAAVQSVQAAAPFPALPSDFREPFLKIHLTLKSEEAWR